MWVTVILSFSLCVWRKEAVYRARAGASMVLALPPPLYQIGWNDFCIALQCVGCRDYCLVKGHLRLFSTQRLAQHRLPTTFVWRLGGASAGRCHSQAPCSFISSVSECVGVSGAGVLPSPSPLSPTHCLPADVAWGRSGPWPSGPCVCVTFAPLNPMVMCYQWDLRLSVSARAARRRRKQDVRGSTVISQCALFQTIPGRSLYSLHTGLPLDIYMCQQSQR